jgi:hypothetical protein
MAGSHATIGLFELAYRKSKGSRELIASIIAQYVLRRSCVNNYFV